MVIIASANCAEKETGDKDHKKEQAVAAFHFLKLISDNQLDLDRDTAISPYCSPKRRREVETRIKRLHDNEFSDTDTLSLDAQFTESNFASILIRSENSINPLDTRIYPVALLRRSDRWVPAPMLGSFSNTGYGYSIEAERSAKKLEAWMSQQKIARETKYIQETESKIKSKIIKIEQEDDLDEMNSEQIGSYFLKQCRDKKTLAILASMGAGSTYSKKQLRASLSLISKALQLAYSSKPTKWHYLSRKCMAIVLEVNEDTGLITVGCFDPEASDISWRFAFQEIHLQTQQQNKRTTIKLTKEFHDLASIKKSRFHLINPRSKQKIISSILKQSSQSQPQLPEQILKHLIEAINTQSFSDFLKLMVGPNAQYSEESTLHKTADLWIRLQKYKNSLTLISDIATTRRLALITIEERQPKDGLPSKKEEIWMVRNNQGWNISPTSMLASQATIIADNIEEKDSQETQVKGLMKELRNHLHEKWLGDTFDDLQTTALPISGLAPSVDDAKKTLALYRKTLLSGDLKACLSHCVILEGSDKNKIMERTTRLVRGAHDQLPDMKILGSSSLGGWISISAKTTSKVSKLDDYPMYLFANTAKGARLFANTDFRYPRNSGRKLLNERHWNDLKKSAPVQSLTTLRSIFDEHIQRCDKEISAIQE